ncbi:MAG: ribosome-associated translation inhibitor RaiA [Clostridia bacterium]|nr:ribosome-associated translation inhibitor RaiA [Clostridia bacterium]
MKITVIGRQINVYEDTKDLINKKLSKFDKYFAGEGEATATLCCKHNLKYMEITIFASNTLFRSEVGADSFREALDGCIENIIRQIRKNKTRLAKRLREDAFDYAAPDVEDPIPMEDEDQPIIRTKSFPIKPMSPEEAILQMNLLGHQFFVFNDDQTNKTCVVYRRKDDTYGLIIPEAN